MRSSSEMGVDSAAGAPLPVMVLAHNEEKHLANCLDSLIADAPPNGIEVYVMANGCTDNTEQVTIEYGRRHPQVKLVSIKMADKCNAWNEFIHTTAVQTVPNRPVYVFVDGDARVVPGSLSALVKGLQQNPEAHAASAPPASGRSMAKDRKDLLEGRHLVANLYALRGTFVNRLIQQGVRLPLGLEGDDGLLGALVKWDLQPDINGFDHMRIFPCADAGFVFESFSPNSLRQIRGYWRRLVRYGRRSYEFQLLGKTLKAQGIRGLPVHISDLYVKSHTLSLGWQGLQTLPNWVALRELRRHADRK